MVVPTDTARGGGTSTAGRPVRPSRPGTWRSRTFKGLVALLCVGVLTVGGGYFYVRHQLGRIRRIGIPGLSDDQAGQAMNVLLVGSDSRANTSGALADAAGRASEGDRPGLSDTVMVLHIDPKQGEAAILSIPRDLWVTVAGSKDRINSAFAQGGPPLLIKTIQDNLGIVVNHYAEVDFSGFQHIVDTVGGLNVYLDAPARDIKSGLDLPTAGCVRLDGLQALSYVRSRYYESYEAGRWVTDPTSDFGRIKRQQDFIRRMIRKALSSGMSNPLTLNRLIGIGADNLTIDSTMSSRDMVNLARRFRSLDPDRVDMQTLPTTPYTTAGGADVLLLNSAEAQPLIDTIDGKAPADPGSVRPADVQVRVLNGNGGVGAASIAAASLQSAGFEITGSGDADSFTYDRTVIRYAATSRAKAQLLQGDLSAGATLQEDPSLGTADVALVVGADFTGVRSPSAAPASPFTIAPAPSQLPNAKGSAQPAC